MSAFLYGAALQWKLDIRSKALLITCYLVPLLFFAVMGGNIYLTHAGGKEYTDTVHDCNGGIHGGAGRPSAFPYRDIWERYQESVQG